ncbi:MAG: 2-hydroxyacyl-CoA dehydratase [Desulfamplus sp.]|nr:2-hydroxyacyl-CoA dehydratase [Desulfamplus sp.]
MLPHLMFNDAYTKQIEEDIYERTVEKSASGTKIVGIYCAFTPRELIAAAGAVPVALCSGSEESFQAAEAHLPANLCPLIKSSYGHAVADSCPYFHMTDFLLADATCDGKKKMFELLNRIKPLHLLQLPQTASTPESIDYWENELRKAASLLEERTGNPITESNLKKQIKLYNRLRITTEAVFKLNTGDIPLVYGVEIDNIIGSGGFEVDIENRIADIEKAIQTVKDRAESDQKDVFLNNMKKRPKILLTGCPSTNKKVLHLIENLGGVVVAMETCGGLKSAGTLIDETIEPIRALAEGSLKIPCACMTPNTKRVDLIGNIIDEYRVDGVVELIWDACHTYNVESFQIQEAVNNKFDSPYLKIKTDYSQNDVGQLETRIEAFLEMLNL